MDPLSITASVLTLLTVCIKVSVELRRLRTGVFDNTAKVNALLADINGLRSVLQLMETIFDEIELRDGFEPSGNIGAHWQSLQESLQDGYETVTELETLIHGLNRSVTLLPGPRRYMRIQAASAQIANLRQQIQVYRDAMQFSLQAITFWNSIKIKDYADKTHPFYDDLNQNFDRLASTIEVKLQSLLELFTSPEQVLRREAMERLEYFVKSAATVYSSSTTTTQQLDKVSEHDATSEILNDSNTSAWIPESDLQLWLDTHPGGAEKRMGEAVVEDAAAITRDQDIWHPPSSNETSFDEIPSKHDSGIFNQSQDVAKVPAKNFSVPFMSRTYSPLETKQIQQIPRPGHNKRDGKDFSPHIDEILTSSRSYEPINLPLTQASLSDQPSIPLTKFLQTFSGAKRQYEHRCKFVFVGDGACGKTCFLIKGSKGTFPKAYMPTVFETYLYNFQIDGKFVELALWDTAGQEEYDKLRPFAYPDAQLVFICFSIGTPTSMDNVVEKWLPEIKQHCGGIPIVLAGLKKDERNDGAAIGKLSEKGQNPISYKQGYQLAVKIGAILYFECSAKTGEGVEEAFETATRTALGSKNKSKASKRSKLRSLLT